MEFFRKYRRVIVLVLVVTVAAWMIGATILLPLLAS